MARKITACPIREIAGAVPGTCAPSKIVVTDENGLVNFPNGTSIAIGGSVLAAAGVSTSTTATTAELNALHSQGAVAADFAKLHALAAVVANAAAAHAHIVNLSTTATGTEISVAVNAILVALETFGINASS